MIEIQNVTKTYSKNNKKAVDNLSLSVKGGELFGFIGPNGAGKTTTIKMLTGVLKPDEGSITMAGHRMDSERLEAQRLIGFVPDGNDLYDRLSAGRRHQQPGAYLFQGYEAEAGRDRRPDS